MDAVLLDAFGMCFLLVPATGIRLCLGWKRTRIESKTRARDAEINRIYCTRGASHVTRMRNYTFWGLFVIHVVSAANGVLTANRKEQTVVVM